MTELHHRTEYSVWTQLSPHRFENEKSKY